MARRSPGPTPPIAAGATFTVEELRRFATASGLQPVARRTAPTVADALFQNPVQVLVHARHLTDSARRPDARLRPRRHRGPSQRRSASSPRGTPRSGPSATGRRPSSTTSAPSGRAAPRSSGPSSESPTSWPTRRAATTRRGPNSSPGRRRRRPGCWTRSTRSPAVESLDGAVPVALLPVRIETRFARCRTPLCTSASSPTRSTSTPTSRSSPTTSAPAAEWYWKQRWPALDDAALGRARLGARSPARFRPGRARYLRRHAPPRQPRPRAPASRPRSPTTARRASVVDAGGRGDRAAGALGGDRLPGHVWRCSGCWSTAVPDRLAAGPSPDELEAPPPPDADAPRPARAGGVPLGASTRRRRRRRDAAHRPRRRPGRSGARSADGLTRLVVLGVDWTLTPEQGARLRWRRCSPATPRPATWRSSRPARRRTTPAATGAGFSTAPVRAGRRLGAAGRRRRPRRRRRAPTPAGSPPRSASTPRRWRRRTGRRRPPPRARVGAGRRALGGDRRVLRVRDARPARQRRHHRRPARARGGSTCTPPGRCRRSASARSPTACCRCVAALGVPPATGSRAEPSHRAGRRRDPLAVGAARRRGPAPRPGRRAASASTTLMLELLQRTPVPWELRWREMVPPPQWSSTDWLSRYRTSRRRTSTRSWSCSGSRRRGAARDPVPDRLARTASRSTCRSSLKGDAGHRVPGRDRRARPRRRRRARRSSTCARTRSRCSRRCWRSPPCQELDKAASASWSTASTADVARPPASSARASARPTSCASRSPTRAGRRCVRVRPRARRHDRRRARTSRVHDQVAPRSVERRLGDLIADVGAARSTASPASSPRSTCCSDAPPDELEWAFRGVLDLYSTRLDAWFTSLATPASPSTARARPAGVHLGCYGWVEDLRARPRRRRADSLGHVAAPSLGARGRRRRAAQRPAVARGLRARSTSTSARARVREAIWRCSKASPPGQSIAALVGYRIERRLTRRRARRPDRAAAARGAAAGPRRATSTSRSSRSPRATWSTASACSALFADAARGAAGRRELPR